MAQKRQRTCAAPVSRCALRTSAEEFLGTLSIAEAYLDHEHDKCYCAACYRGPDCISNEGPSAYVVPRGWVRFGLKLPPRGSDPELDIFNKWNASFHGVKSTVVLKSVLQCGSLMKPGDTLLDGTALGSTKCGARTDKVIYTSPTVKYAGLKFYAEPLPFGDGMAASMVLQCRQKPGSFTSQGETMGFRRWTGHLERECPHVDLRNIEWKTECNAAPLPYGLLIRPFVWGLNPREYGSPVDEKCSWRRKEAAEEAAAKERAEAGWPAAARAMSARVAQLEADNARLVQQAEADSKEIAELKAQLGGGE